MKNRITLAALIACALFALVAPPGQAAQSLTTTPSFNDRAGGAVPNRWVLSWVSDSSGNVTQTTSTKVWGTICRVIIDPGATAPTALYDATLTDEAGIDLLVGQGANLSATDTTSFVPLLEGTDGTTTAMFPIIVNDTLTLTITNAGADKTGSFIVYTR